MEFHQDPGPPRRTGTPSLTSPKSVREFLARLVAETYQGDIDADVAKACAVLASHLLQAFKAERLHYAGEDDDEDDRLLQEANKRIGAYNDD